MITSGLATIYVKDMDRAVDFYTRVLGLQLRMRAGNHWAEVETKGLVIGLHPATPDSPAPGKHGSIQIGLQVEGSLDEVVRNLEGKGVAFTGPIIDDTAVRLAYFGDPDGTNLYLCEVQPPHSA